MRSLLYFLCGIRLLVIRHPSSVGDVITIGGVVTEEQDIAHSKYLDQVYTQSGTLYDNIPNASGPEKNAPLLLGKESHAIDGIIGSDILQSLSQPYGIALTSSSQNPQSHPLTASTIDINSFSSNKGKQQQTTGSKKKGKGKKKKDSSLEDKKINYSSDEKRNP